MIYIALGDSISIDEYPDQELGSKKNGAAQLLANKLFLRGHIDKFVNLTRDGAQIGEVMTQQVPRVRVYNEQQCVITITMGGNDISYRSMRTKQRNVACGDEFQKLLSNVIRDYTDAVIEIRRQFPNSLLVLNTLYDPTDGTGLLPKTCGAWADIGFQYSTGRRYLGNYIRNWGTKLNFAVVADIFKLFDGKGMAEGNRSGMYYDQFMIEPGAIGAREIARLWLQTYENAALAYKPEEKTDDRSDQAVEECVGVCAVQGRGDQDGGSEPVDGAGHRADG